MAGSGKEHVNGTTAEWGPARFMGTASVAADMLRIVQKLGQDKLQYWGLVRCWLACGFSEALILDAELRLDPWPVLLCHVSGESWPCGHWRSLRR